MVAGAETRAEPKEPPRTKALAVTAANMSRMAELMADLIEENETHWATPQVDDRCEAIVVVPDDGHGRAIVLMSSDALIPLCSLVGGAAGGVSPLPPVARPLRSH